MRKSSFFAGILLAITPLAAGAQTCEGLKTPAGSYSGNLNKNRNALGKLCGKSGDGQGSPLDKSLQQAERKLAACDKLSSKLPFQAKPILEQIRKRYGSACGAQKNYVTESDIICRQYGTIASRRNAATRALEQDEAADPASQHAYFQQLASMHAGLKSDYDKLERAAGGSRTNLEAAFKHSDAKGDPTMKTLVDALKNQVTNQARVLEQQASAKLKQRERLAAGAYEADSNPGAIRFRNKKEVNDFYRNLAACKSVTRDLDQFEKTFQDRLAKPLGGMKEEAEQAKAFFAKESVAHGEQMTEMESRGKKIGGTSGISQPKAPVDPMSESLAFPTP